MLHLPVLVELTSIHTLADTHTDTCSFKGSHTHFHLHASYSQICMDTPLTHTHTHTRDMDQHCLLNCLLQSDTAAMLHFEGTIFTKSFSIEYISR